jgi:hypothetical protein
VAKNSQDAPLLAMRGKSLAAKRAGFAKAKPRAPDVNFAHHARANPFRIPPTGDAHDLAHELVAQGPLKIVIAAQNFDVRVADPGKPHADKRPARPQPRQRFLNDNNAFPAGNSC